MDFRVLTFVVEGESGDEEEKEEDVGIDPRLTLSQTYFNEALHD